MSQMPVFNSDVYDPSMTKQAFKDETDINKLLARSAKGDAITHLAKHGAIYGDFSDIDDLLTAQNRLKRGEEIFAELPGEIRREFDQSPRKFYNYVNDPANQDQLAALLPGLADQGTQLRTLRRSNPNPELPPTPPNAAPAATEPPPAATPPEPS